MQKVVLITGGSRGIGAATARKMAAQGYAVAINYHSDAVAVERVYDEIAALPKAPPCCKVQADVADEAQVQRMFAQITEQLGPITHLVNNAGVVDRACQVVDMPWARWRRMFDVNVLGSMLCAREALKTMLPAGKGAIVNVSSVAARLGSPGQYVDYAAAKAAVDAFTLGLAREVAGQGVRVNAVRPGIIDTEIHASGGQPDRVMRLGPEQPMGRAGQPEEVADSIVWLMSDQASYVTGAILDVAGGR